MTETDSKIARFAGTCKICSRYHISHGDIIVPHFGGWGSIVCKEKHDGAYVLLQVVEKNMLEKHNIALGVWGIPEGAKPTWTRNQFIGYAEEFKELDSDGIVLLRWLWSGILNYSMDD